MSIEQIQNVKVLKIFDNFHGYKFQITYIHIFFLSTTVELSFVGVRVHAYALILLTYVNFR